MWEHNGSVVDSRSGRVAQSVTCLATDACLTADPGVASSIPVRSHTFVEIDHEMISRVILFPSADSFKKGCCQLQQGCHGPGKSSGKLKMFQVREKSGNFIFSQGNLEKMKKVMEKSGNFKKIAS